MASPQIIRHISQVHAFTTMQRTPVSTTINHQFKLAARPHGNDKSTDWSCTEEAVHAPTKGEVVI